MKAKLVVVGGEAKAGEIDLKLPATVGRGREASLTLPHPLVSREHCEIYESNGRLFVRDLGSLNGTFINNQRIEGEAELPIGDLLTIGTVTFRADYEDQPDLRPPAGGGKIPTVRASAAGTISTEKASPIDDDSTKKGATSPPPDEDNLDDDEFEGFGDLDFDDLDDETEEHATDDTPAEMAPLAQPLPDPTGTTAETEPLPEPAPPVPLAQPTAIPAAETPPLPSPSAPAQGQSLPNPTPPGAQAPVAHTPAVPVAEPQTDNDSEDDDDLNAFLNGLD